MSNLGLDMHFTYKHAVNMYVQVARDRAEGRGTAGGARYAEGSFPRDGSTATVLLLVGSTLFAANCGDSAGEVGLGLGWGGVGLRVGLEPVTRSTI